MANNNKANEQKIKETNGLYKKVFSSDEGKRVMEDMKRSLHHGANVYYAGQTNQDLHFLLGRQSVINDILFMIEKKD